MWRGFPDVQALLKAALESDITGPALGVDHVGLRTPDDLAAALPFVRIRRGGGGSSRSFDQPIVDIDAFDGTYAAAQQLAERIRVWLVGPPSPVALFDWVRCDSGPTELPWPSTPLIHRFGLTFSLETRRRTVH